MTDYSAIFIRLTNIGLRGMTLISIPMFHGMTDEQQEEAVNTLTQVLGHGF